MIKRSLQIVSFLFAAFFFASIKSDEVCPGNYPTHDIITANGVSSSFTQTGCVKSFEVDITSSDLNKYLMFEIEFTSTLTDPLWMPFLLGYEIPSPIPAGQTSATARTSLLLNSGTLTVPSLTSSDSNGFLNRKSYHYIIMGPDKLNAAKKFVFSMFKTYSDSTQQYTGNFVYQVTASLSISYPCPQACSGPSQGTCDTQNKKCVCLSSYFDEDCSVLANPLKLSELSSQSISPYSWGYFFFNIGSFDNDLKITLQKQAGDMQYSFLINEPDDYTIPNSAQSIGKYELSASQLEGYLLIREDDISTRKNDIILIGVYNDNSASATAQVTLESYDDASVIRTVSVYLMIGLSVALLIVWLGISGLKYKHHTQMESLIRAYQAEREEEKTLTKKDINKYFPKEKFSALKTSFCQTMCSVCLEDFEAETVCRQLYCEHIYHANCIEAWLAQHYNCPNCKKDITKVAIEEHLKEKANKEEKSMLMQDNKAAEKRGELGSPNQSITDGQRVHIRKVREEEETKENNDYAFGHAEHRTKPRNLTITTAVNIESNIRESNLQLAAIHEEGKHRNLSRVDKDFSSNPGEASRTELHSRSQNLRRPKRPGQPGTEAGVDALRLDL